MANLSTTKVSKIVAENFRTAKVFSDFGIDFCCNGGIPLIDACKQNNVDIDDIMVQLELVIKDPDSVDYQSMELDELIDFIIRVHHNYVQATIPVLKQYLDKLSKVHSERHPELHQINNLFIKTSEALINHMRKEEQILFPFIKEMCETKDKNTSCIDPYFGHIDNPIAMMEMEHAAEGESFRQIADLSNQYTCPPDGCQTYQVAYAVLDEFEEDLHKHIHMENNILFPKAKLMFAEMKV